MTEGVDEQARYDRRMIAIIIEAVRMEQGRYHPRDGPGPSNGTYFDIAKRTGIPKGEVVKYLRMAEARGYIRGYGFHTNHGRGGAKRWEYIEPDEWAVILGGRGDPDTE